MNANDVPVQRATHFASHVLPYILSALALISLCIVLRRRRCCCCQGEEGRALVHGNMRLVTAEEGRGGDDE